MEKKSGTWRLLYHPPAGGAWNMAVDEALLEAVGRGVSAPILRLYAWKPACLSLGQAQSAADVDGELLAGYGWDLVRRPTGGSAILHINELTYAVVAPLDEPRVKGTLMESYLAISRALTRALGFLGMEVTARDDAEARQVARSRNPVCFEQPSSYEIIFQGKKIIGSAQARRGAAFLQHGALPLAGDITRITQVLKYNDQSARQQAAAALVKRATTVEAATGRQVTWKMAANAFAAGFKQALGIDLQMDNLNETETCLAVEIMQQKYASNTWTLRK
jgi:lipoate-protein ligase A